MKAGAGGGGILRVKAPAVRFCYLARYRETKTETALARCIKNLKTLFRVRFPKSCAVIGYG